MIEFHDVTPGATGHLIVAFTGISQGLGGIPFEFHRSLGSVRAKALFVRDTAQRWYQYEQTVVDATVERIRVEAAAAGATRVSCIGNSMGGFGALLFGALCQADAILAFAPQTTILPAQTAAMDDRRWQVHQNRMETFPFGDIDALPAPTARVTVHYGADAALDAAHAARLTWPHRRIAHPGCGHNVASFLRERAELVGEIVKALYE